MTTEVMFVRLDPLTYEIGPPGGTVPFSLQEDQRNGTAMCHAALAERGRRVDVTHLMPHADRQNPARCASNWIARARRNLGDLSIELGAALAGVRCLNAAPLTPGGSPRVIVIAEARRNGVLVHTHP